MGGRVSREIATACFMGLNVLARYIELERRIVEQEQVMERLEALESALDSEAHGDLGRGVG